MSFAPAQAVNYVRNTRWVRWVLIAFAVAIGLLLLFKLMKPILEFFNLGESDDKPNTKGKTIEVDAREVVEELNKIGLVVDPSFNIEHWANEFKRVIDNIAWFGYSQDRCNVLTRANNLSDAELAAVMKAYEKATASSLRGDIIGLTVTGCSGSKNRPDKPLLETMARLEESVLL